MKGFMDGVTDDALKVISYRECVQLIIQLDV